MAFRELVMIDVKDALRRWQAEPAGKREGVAWLPAIHDDRLCWASQAKKGGELR
jgi:hypothetical protein